jgi:hypothetical protein
MLNVGPFYSFPPYIKRIPTQTSDLPWQKTSVTLLVLRNSVAMEVVAMMASTGHLQLKKNVSSEENKGSRER